MEMESDSMQDRFLRTIVVRQDRRESACATIDVDELCRLQMEANLVTRHTLEYRERRRRMLKLWVATWPVALGLILGWFAPQLGNLLVRFQPWTMWVVFPFAVLAGSPDLHLTGQLARIVPLAALHAQFPLEGLLVRIVLRTRVTLPDVLREVVLFHFLGAAELCLVSGIFLRFIPS